MTDPKIGKSTYISHFEICPELGRLRDEDKVLALAAALKGLAKTFIFVWYKQRSGTTQS